MSESTWSFTQWNRKGTISMIHKYTVSSNIFSNRYLFIPDSRSFNINKMFVLPDCRMYYSEQISEHEWIEQEILEDIIFH